MDHAVAHALNHLFAAHDGLEDPLKAYSAASVLGFAALVAALGLAGLWERRLDLLDAAIAAAGSAAVALLIGMVISAIAARSRPFVSDPAIHLFAAHPADPGFPSDHATASFAIATAIALRLRGLGLCALAAAALLAVDRVALGLHWPTDVLGGAALGAGTALALYASPIRSRMHRAVLALDDAVPAQLRPARARSPFTIGDHGGPRRNL